MSIEQSLSNIIDEDQASTDAKHKVTRYRRRDLRNSLASRIGTIENLPREGSEERGRESSLPPKRRVKLTNIPLDVSDYTLEDMMKEYGNPIYSNIYDSKDSRTAVFEFEDEAVIEKILEKYNDTDLNGARLRVEVFNLNDKKNRRRNRRANQFSSRGSHYGVRKERGTQRERVKMPTVQDLDAELEEYMNS
ncbi:hypothetical protein HG536_0G04800 [Torulaspora globosa]|uniref:RRM domain-containing protein n=1 Tax=Torulaspora globosa TaxID=48254 RepID=A0A7G3ZM82_9SACH|nr:uncharacterized protein HG536_0G04800 [Torulaspora globosa]QLL34618.1 hypothetical protein HG536_0G04800 [Torulaspora globosa]